MIDTVSQTTCLACGKPLVQVEGRGHRKKLYCDDLCRQRAHRAKGQAVTIDTNGDLQQRIAELERELAAAHHPALTIPIRVQAGERAHRVFELSASNELLEEGNVTLRRQLEE